MKRNSKKRISHRKISPNWKHFILIKTQSFTLNWKTIRNSKADQIKKHLSLLRPLQLVPPYQLSITKSTHNGIYISMQLLIAYRIANVFISASILIHARRRKNQRTKNNRETNKTARVCSSEWFFSPMAFAARRKRVHVKYDAANKHRRMARSTMFSPPITNYIYRCSNGIGVAQALRCMRIY